MTGKKNVLITGCSKGGLGDALAQEFARHGHQVIATARNPTKTSHFKALGVQTLVLDVTSKESIQQCVLDVSAKLGNLDILINNSGAAYSMPLADASLEESRKVFELNVFAPMVVTQEFLPLLLRSKQGAVIANNSSISSVCPTPMQGVYNASKAAIAMMTDTLRLELKPFNISVVDLKTGAVQSNLYANQPGGFQAGLPTGSIYALASGAVEKAIRAEEIVSHGTDRKVWAEQVVSQLLASKPPVQVWKGTNSFGVWMARRFLPFTFLDSKMLKMGGLDVVKQNLAKRDEKHA